MEPSSLPRPSPTYLSNVDGHLIAIRPRRTSGRHRQSPPTRGVMTSPCKSLATANICASVKAGMLRVPVEVVQIDVRLIVWPYVPIRVCKSLPARALSRLDDVGRDADDPSLDARAFVDLVAQRRTPIKLALLDQRMVSGIGNIYASESLWRARIDPRRAANALNVSEIRKLFSAIRAVGICRSRS